MNWAKVGDSIVDFTQTHIEKIDPLLAAEEAIFYIQKEYPKPYYLMVSGGIDSQAMLYCWNQYGSNFIPTSVRYDDFNADDLATIEVFAKNFNIDINYINFDIINFLNYEYDSFSEQFRCSSPCISTHIKMIENLQGTVIFSGDFLSEHKSAILTDAILGLYRASLQRKNIIPYFFLYTPNLAYSMLHKKIDTSLTYQLSEYDKKVFRYTYNGLPVLKQKDKTTGFEKIKDFYDLYHKDKVPAINKLKYHNRSSKRTFDLLFRYPYEEKYNDRYFRFLLNSI